MMGGDMELVRQFNSELSSIYENKPPISKAKMASITRYAVKALKYYKHIVHSVEKFIHKCHDEYKICGLYVLDSIIRQSRHQFGPDKDLFGPRFQKNIKLLFQHIFQCPPEDKPKIVRVLNLWQKNGIYPPDVISPLIDMASTSSKVLAASIQRQKKARATASKHDHHRHHHEHHVEYDDLEIDDDLPVSQNNKKQVQMSQDDEIQVLKAQLEQQRKQQELLQQQLQMQIMATKQQSLQLQLQQQQMQTKIPAQTQQSANQEMLSNPSADLLSQIQELTQQLERDKTALANISSSNDGQQQQQNQPQQQQQQQPGSVENQTQFLENFQHLIQTAKGIIQKDPRQQSGHDVPQSHETEPSPKFNQALLDNTFEYEEENGFNGGQNERMKEEDNRHPRNRNVPRGLPMQEFGSSQYQSQDSSFMPKQPLPFQSHQPSFQQQQQSFQQQQTEHSSHHQMPPHHLNQFGDDQPPQKKPLLDFREEFQQQQQMDDDDAMQIDNDDDYQQEFYQPDQPLQDSHQRKSRWGPQPREDRSSDVRAIDIVNERGTAEDEEIEKRKREKSVMPPAMHKRMTVASTTIWIGRLPKGCHPDVVRNAFSEFGEIKSIDLIDARGCAFLTMGNRYEADRALRNLRYERLDGYDVKMAWGQPRELQEFSKFWEESFGAAFIPWDMVKEYHLSALSESCIIAEDTLPPGMSLHKHPVEDPKGNQNVNHQPPIWPRPAMMPPPPPGMLPPMGMLRMFPMGFRPPLRPLPPQNVLPRADIQQSNSGGPRAPLLQGPEDPRGPNEPNISIANLFPRSNAPLNVGGRPLFLGRPPFNISGQPRFNVMGSNEIFNRPAFQIHQPIRPVGVRESIPHQAAVMQGGNQPPWPPVSQQVNTWIDVKKDEYELRNASENVNKEVRPEDEFIGNKIPTLASKVEDSVADKHWRKQENTQSSPEKLKEEKEKRYRESDNNKDGRSERRDRYDRRDDRSDRRDRGRVDFRERESRDDRNRRDRDNRGERNRYDRDSRDARENRSRFDRDDRDSRGERYSREDRDGRQRDRFGRDEFGRDEDRSRRNERDRNKSRDRDSHKSRSPRPDRGFTIVDKETKEPDQVTKEPDQVFRSTFQLVSSENQKENVSNSNADTKPFQPFAVVPSTADATEENVTGEETISPGKENSAVSEHVIKDESTTDEKVNETIADPSSELYDPLEAAMSPDDKESEHVEPQDEQQTENKDDAMPQAVIDPTPEAAIDATTLENVSQDSSQDVSSNSQAQQITGEEIQDTHDSPIFPLDNKSEAIFEDTTNGDKENAELELKSD
ncbi:SR-related and CTD-associated factor 4-like [Hydractinia symbiolongicarpus]|uniref:SR-related and CTD-associated factor 4-like n=1 Tax=Hydractinia symbiolongicarpus TaxID=13093 RepID=UPI00254CD02B|nr:SR-related and CTD-associated factor 4-like [Hydractinia symbiolongicarpus]